MNKFIKGTIAGSAGIALLMGGAGSFALWSDSTTVNAGVVSSGVLDIVNKPGDGVWKDASGTVIENINDYRIVPGDTLSYTDGFKIKASGDNLSADLTLDLSTVGNVVHDAADVALLGQLASHASVHANSFSSNLTWAGNKVTVKGSDTPADVNVTVTFTFPEGVAGDNTTQGGHINLNGIGFKLTQV